MPDSRSTGARSASSPDPAKSDLAAGLVIYAATAFVFYPLTRFLFTRTVGQDQLLHSFIVLVLAGAFIVFERRLRLRPAWKLGRWSLSLLGASYALLLVVLITKWNFLMIPSYCFAVASAAIFAFGEGTKRFVGAFVGAFALFQAFVLALPLLDWPLRGIAGQFSARALGALGSDVQLVLYKHLREPMLILIHNGKEFHVAPECNGFGVMVSAFLLSMLLILYRRIPLWTKASAFLSAGAIGLAFNVLRIAIIVLLAPVVGSERYFLMHEIVGVIIYYAALLVIWWIVQRIPVWSDPDPTEAT